MEKINNKKYSTTRRPNQRVSNAEKQQKHWYIPNGEYHITYCLNHNTDKIDLERYYNIANGIIQESDYSYVTNPYHANNPKLKQFPANMRNHDLIQPILLRFIGEYIKSNFEPIVGINNADSGLKKIEAKRKELNPYLSQLIADSFKKVSNGTVDLSQATPEGEQDPSIKEKDEEFEDNWKDSRAIIGQQVVSYLRDELSLDEMYINAYVHWIIAGQFYTHREVHNDKVLSTVVHPLEYYPILNGSSYIEDTNLGMRKFKMSINDIISYFRYDLDLKDIKYIEDLMLDLDYSSGSINLSNALISDRYGNAFEYFKDKYGTNGADINITNQEGLIDVYHVVFTTQTQIQILVYEDALGEMKKKEVDIDYKIDRANGDLHLEKEWVNEMWEQYRIGDEALGLYTIPKAVTVQRHEINNTSKIKNPYGGKAFMYDGILNPSIVKPLIPYQVIYNIIHYYRELAIAKNKGKLLMMPKGLLIDDDQISQEEAVYYIKSDGTLYVDETADNFQSAQQGVRSIDLSDAQYIQSLSAILLELKEEAWETVGMNRQRYGDTMASDGKGTTEQAIYRASMGSTPITEVFNQARYKDYMALIDTAKVAYLNEDNSPVSLGNFVNPDGRLEYLSLYPQDFLESEIGLYVASFKRDKEKIEQYKQVAFAASQNGAFELGLEAIEFDNPHKLKRILKNWRKAEDTKAQQQQEMQQEQIKLQQDREDNRFNIEQETQRYIADIRAKSTVDAAAVRVEVTALQNEDRDADRRSAEAISEATNQAKERSDKYKADKQLLAKSKAK